MSVWEWGKERDRKGTSKIDSGNWRNEMTNIVIKYNSKKNETNWRLFILIHINTILC